MDGTASTTTASKEKHPADGDGIGNDQVMWVMVNGRDEQQAG
jgi:hypothetical protein